MNEHEQSLWRQLTRDATRSPKWTHKQTPCGFVLEHGWYAPDARPANLPAGTVNECFVNAFMLALDDPSLTYREGYAVAAEGGRRDHHAWVTDDSGRAIDVTWPTPGVAYAGVPFDTTFLNLSHLKNRAIICVIDDYVNNWPILGELGDHPERWAARCGKGNARLADVGGAGRR
jgi:hypothetical protein